MRRERRIDVDEVRIVVDHGDDATARRVGIEVARELERATFDVDLNIADITENITRIVERSTQ